MLHVHNDNIVVEEKGIYSIEKFLVARRLMYWQVYLHKTSLVADLMLKNAFLRAKKILQNGQKIGNIPTCLLALLTENYKGENELLSLFTQVDDADAICSLKSFMSHDDEILKRLSSGLINRVLFKIEFLPEKIADEKYNQISPQFNEDERSYFLLNGEVMNNAYNPKKENIFILFKDGSIRDIAEIAEQMNIRSLSNEVVKYYLAYPENNLVLN
jgi:HD superfamily phosphohydrolase